MITNLRNEVAVKFSYSQWNIEANRRSKRKRDVFPWMTLTMYKS